MISVTAGDRLKEGETGDLEYSFEQPFGARFRAHAFHERGRWALALRVIPQRIPTFQELRLPPVVKTLALAEPGLTLVTGPTGNGKSTTLAAMMQHLTTSEMVHLLTIEDPIEYMFVGVASCVSQREVGRDVTDSQAALRSALREDPDVLLIGEIRDLPTLEVAIHAAESGHAVFSSFHTHGAAKTIQGAIGLFPTEQQSLARARLADCLRAVVSQVLLPRRGARGQVLATEVLVNNYRVREYIRDPARTPSLAQVLEKSGDQHMHTFDQCLLAMARDGVIEPSAALLAATAPSDLRRSLALLGISV